MQPHAILQLQGRYVLDRKASGRPGPLHAETSQYVSLRVKHVLVNTRNCVMCVNFAVQELV